MIFKKVTFFIALSFVFCTTNAQIIYTDINPDITTTLSNPPSEANNIVSIDFNGDNTEEYNFSWNYTLNGDWFIRMDFGDNELNRNGTLMNPSGSWYIEPMSYGDAIDSDLNWENSPEYFLIGDNSSPNFQNLGERCVGCKFKLGTNTHYGWVRVSFDNNKTLTVKDYAYESSPDMEICAGCGTVSVNEISFDTYFNIYPIPTSTRLTIETKNEVKIKSVRLINLTGQIIYSTNETLLHTIDIPESLQGLYFLQIETSKNKILTKKIIIE